MSQENVEVVRRAFEDFAATGMFDPEVVTPDFVWDMSHFHGWPEKQRYEGAAGAATFLAEWTAAWDDWQLHLDELLDAGELVVTLLHQHGRSKTTQMPVDMSFAMVWTVRDGKEARMEMYSDPAEALAAAGLGPRR